MKFFSATSLKSSVLRFLHMPMQKSVKKILNFYSPCTEPLTPLPLKIKVSPPPLTATAHRLTILSFVLQSHLIGLFCYTYLIHNHFRYSK